MTKIIFPYIANTHCYATGFAKVKLIIQELTTEEIIKKILDNNLDAGLAATPLENEFIKESPLYYEPFVGLTPHEHRLYKKNQIEIDDLVNIFYRGTTTNL